MIKAGVSAVFVPGRKVKHREHKRKGVVVPSMPGIDLCDSRSVLVEFDGAGRIVSTLIVDLEALEMMSPQIKPECRGCVFCNGKNCYRFDPTGRYQRFREASPNSVLPKRIYPLCQKEVSQAPSLVPSP